MENHLVYTDIILENHHLVENHLVTWYFTRSMDWFKGKSELDKKNMGLSSFNFR